MRYAIVKIGGTQYKVSEGEEIVVDKLPQKEKAKIEFPDVLLAVNDKKAAIGTPYVDNAKIKASIVEQFKDKKIRVAVYKAKSRHRRVKGFRAHLTKIKIDKISAPWPPWKSTL